MNKDEVVSMSRYGYDGLTILKPNEQIINSIIAISNGRGRLHDSGFPYIQVYGETEDKALVDLGVHDHIWFYECEDVNIDSLGKNIFRYFSHQWNGMMKICSKFIPCSTLMIDAKNMHIR
jgi:hypothetical protein